MGKKIESGLFKNVNNSVLPKLYFQSSAVHVSISNRLIGDHVRMLWHNTFIIMLINDLNYRMANRCESN